MMLAKQLTVEALAPQNVLEKLARAKIAVYSARKRAKNIITFRVRAKDLEKVFAILHGSCYNILEVRDCGLGLLYKKCLARSGLIAGALCFLVLVPLFQSRVLKIEVVGSGGYYEAQVLEVLERGGVRFFSAPPRQTAVLVSEILSLPRVSYCSIGCEGGVLTVEVQVGEEDLVSLVPLKAPSGGKIEELVAVRGTPLHAVGDVVEKGDILVGCFAEYGESRREVAVIARVKISFPVEKRYQGTEESARAQAFLEFGEISSLALAPSGEGWLVTGTAYASAALNMDGCT